MTGAAGQEDPILALFEAAGPVETPTPGVRAWLARDRTDGQKPLLIKRLSGTGGSGGKGRATEALALLHPSIVRTRRWMVHEGALYVVRDVVRGKNLRQTLTGSGIERSPGLVQRMLLPVIDALIYAHGQGFAHGGVSPENVLIADDGSVYVSDWATVDPKAPQHFRNYEGTASVGGDIRALSGVVNDFLPNSGAFTRPAVRERIGGVLSRCTTLTDIKDTVSALERLAAAPLPSSSGGGGDAGTRKGAGKLDLGLEARGESPPAASVTAAGAGGAGIPRLTCTLVEKSARVPQGGGGVATLIVKNEGTGPLSVRMIATQHPWLNVRPIDLPLEIPPGGYKPVGFAISAARLTAGEYRSEVYLSANAAGKTAEDLRGGWFKHTAEIRITVEGGPTFNTPADAGPGKKATTPANAPKVPPRGAGFALALPLMLLSALMRGFHYP